MYSNCSFSAFNWAISFQTAFLGLVTIHFLGEGGDLIHTPFTAAGRRGLVALTSNAKPFNFFRRQLGLILSGLDSRSVLGWGPFHISLSLGLGHSHRLNNASRGFSPRRASGEHGGPWLTIQDA